ncbi:MAG: hypothetical protein AAF317_20915 [Pseudomonadota bacterium]
MAPTVQEIRDVARAEDIEARGHVFWDLNVENARALVSRNK